MEYQFIETISSVMILFQIFPLRRIKLHRAFVFDHRLFDRPAARNLDLWAKGLNGSEASPALRKVTGTFPVREVIVRSLFKANVSRFFLFWGHVMCAFA